MQLSFLGLKMEPSDTITTFALKVDEYMGNKNMSGVCEPVIRHRFGMADISDTEVMAVCDLYTETETRIRKQLGLLRYLFRRVLLGKRNG